MIFRRRSFKLLIAVYSGTFPKTDWTVEQVAEWARKVLNFSEKSANILIEQEINGRALLDPPVKDLAELVALLPGVPTGQTKRMWAEIEKMKKAQADSGMC